jgi:hypothetical protein
LVNTGLIEQVCKDGTPYYHKQGLIDGKAQLISEGAGLIDSASGGKDSGATFIEWRSAQRAVLTTSEH